MKAKRAKNPKCPYDFKPFQQELRRLGFVRKYPTMRINANVAPGYVWSQIYHKVGKDFDLEVMLESTGEHCARHFFKGRSTERGTEFMLLEFVEAAVDVEMKIIERKRTGWQTPEMKEIDKIWALRNAHMKTMEDNKLSGADITKAHYAGHKSCLTEFKDGRALYSTQSARGIIRHVWSRAIHAKG